MKLDALHNSPVDAINTIALRIKRKLERLGAQQVEVYRANQAEPEASIQADISDHVILREILLVRVTSPEEFLIQVPTKMARMIGIKDSQVIHGLDNLHSVVAHIMNSR